MKKFILQCYEEFHTFMKIKKGKLPQLNPVSFEVNETNSIAYVDLDIIQYPVTNIYYSVDFCKYQKEYKKVKLFHEFTHIVDKIILSKDYNPKDLSIIMSTYSEYHASKIELMKNLGFKDVSSIHKMDLSATIVFNEQDKCSITTDYLQPLAEATIIISKPKLSYYNLSVKEYYLKYKKFMVNTMYYLGKKNLCRAISVKPHPDLTEEWYGEFYPFIHNIEKAILERKLDDIPQLEKELWNKFVDTFSFKDMKMLNEVMKTV